jgi:hypothetical protein
MRSWLRQRFSTLALMAALGSTCHAQTALPGTDIRSYLSADISAKLSLAGTWIPIDTTAIIVGPYYNVIRLGASQQEGVALGGWAWNNSFTSTLPDTTPVRAALLEQQADGTLVDASARLLGDAFTNGAGSIIVADFNGDGLDDLVLPAHNESPFLWKHSTAWISRPGAGLDKLTLADNVMDHDARLVVLDGKKKIFARSWGGSGNNGNGAGFNLLYSWAGNTLVADTSLGDLGGSSVLAGPFTGNADSWLIVGDSRGGGPGGLYSPTNPALTYAYKYVAGVAVTPRVLLPKPYFNDKPAFASFDSQWDPYSKTHTSRLWTTDLNQDGLPDILAGQGIWSAGPAGLQKAVLQLLVNRGDMMFTDDTDALAPEFSQDSFQDLSVRLADVDGSGIDTMFHSSNPVFDGATDASKQGQYILVNDGTGRLYAAMHDEFRAMRTQIAGFLNPLIPGGGTSNAITPQFIAYRTASGTLNFVAVVHYFMPNLAPQHRFAFINVPLEINLATDFRRDLTIATRNGSKRIRTFAGNDTIRRALSDPDCSIDGGLGTNTAVYPGNKAAWIITKTSGELTVRPASGPGGTDTLTRIQRAQFDDQTVDLTSIAPGAAANYQGLWWNAPAGSESGWGINFAHQGDVIFASWFTYDATGKGLWLVMTAPKAAPDTYSGSLYTTTGPAFNAVPFNPANVVATQVGTGTLIFSDANNGSFAYSVNGISQTKAITREVFGTVPICTFGTQPNLALASNFQDLWWAAPAGVESGWGINFTHQGDTIFATWFTYDLDHTPMWLVVTAPKIAPNVFSGTLYRTIGPAFSAVPFNPASVASNAVGAATFTFSDGNNATFAYTANAVTQTKQITRQVFRTPGTMCL